MKTVVRPLLAMLLCTALRLLPGQSVFAQETSPQISASQDESKTLYRLAEFVEWPEASAQRNSTFNFCILGKDPFGKTLEDAVLGHPVDDKPTMIVRGSYIDELGLCNILFISSSETKGLPKILSKLRNKSILTVSEAPNFAEAGGIIQFTKSAGRTSFVINMDAAERAGLRVRAQLLSLATLVHENGGARKSELKSRE